MSKSNLKSKLSDAANIPKDVLLGVPLIQLIGQEELYIENYRGILEYTDSFVRVQTKIGQIHVCGRHLEILYYTNDEMKISGRIESLTYHSGGHSA